MLALLLWNPAAGGGRADSIARQVAAGLTAAGVETEVHRTTSLADARTMAARAAWEVDLVVAVGGDGTFGACAEGLAQAAASVPSAATADAGPEPATEAGVTAATDAGTTGTTGTTAATDAGTTETTAAGDAASSPATGAGAAAVGRTTRPDPDRATRRPRAALGVVPAGSGNDVAISFGMPTGNPAAMADLLVTLPRRPVDVVRVELGGITRRYIDVAATGFDGQVNELANRIPLRGRPRYIGATLLRLPFSRPSRFTLDLDGPHTPRDGDTPAAGDPMRAVGLPAWMVTVANGPTYGGGLRIAPTARMDDRLLDVVVVGRMTRRSLLRALPTVFDGSHLANPAVTVRRARRVTVTAEPAVPVYADGEALGTTPATFTVEPAAIDVLATPDAPGLAPPRPAAP